MIDIDINENKKISKLARNILNHFKKYLEQFESSNYRITMIDEYVIGNNNLRVDFAFLKTNPPLFIEVDGIQHKKIVKHWGGETGLLNRKTNDDNKEAILFAKYPEHILIRFDENYIDYDTFIQTLQENGVEKLLATGDVLENKFLDNQYYKKKKKKGRTGRLNV